MTFESLAVCLHNYKDSYSDGDDFSLSDLGTPQTLIVAKADSSVGIFQSPTSPVFGQQVTFTATVSAKAPGAGQPGGSVTFTIDGTGVATKTLTAGTASFSTSSLSVGSHKLVVSYGGDGNFNSGTSSTSNF